MGPTLRRSRLDRHGPELLALRRAGATVAQLTRWLRIERNTVVAATTVGRWLDGVHTRGIGQVGDAPPSAIATARYATSTGCVSPARPYLAGCGDTAMARRKRARRGRDQPRLARFEEVEGPLSNLLRLFGPPNKVHHAEYPFGRLRRDGLWEIPNDTGLPQTRSGDLHKRPLLRHRVEGGLPESVHQMLLADRELIASAAQLLLQGHFPESLHDDIRAAVGLRWEWVVRDAPVARDPNFRSAVLRAYERDAPSATMTFGSATSCLGWRRLTSSGMRRAGLMT